MSRVWLPETSAAAEFLSPSLVASGSGARGRAAQILAGPFALQPGPVLVAVDDVVLAAGLAAALLEGLENAGWTTHVVSGFGSEPAAATIDAAAETARAVGAVAVVGIGGGSVLDSAKLLALLARNEGSVASWLGAVDPAGGIAPLLLLPTTCGTGSEATRIAMVTVDGAKRASSCGGFVPRGVVIDPELVASLPPGVIASTGMDALAHAVESLMSTTRSPLSAHHALRAVDILASHLEPATRGEKESLAACLWASHLAGQALNAGVVVGHSLAYCLAFETPMPHGTSCALALPYCLAYNADLDPALAATIAGALTGGASTDLRRAADGVQALARRLGLPTTLADARIDEGAERRIAQRCVREYPRPTNPVPLEEDRLYRLVTAMRHGDLDAAFAARPASDAA